MSPIIESLQTRQRRAAFMRATKGADAYTVAQALNTFVPGLDFRKCPRGHMADAWARAPLAQLEYKNLRDVKLDHLAKMITSLLESKRLRKEHGVKRRMT